MDGTTEGGVTEETRRNRSLRQININHMRKIEDIRGQYIEAINFIILFASTFLRIHKDVVDLFINWTIAIIVVPTWNEKLIFLEENYQMIPYWVKITILLSGYSIFYTINMLVRFTFIEIIMIITSFIIIVYHLIYG